MRVLLAVLVVGAGSLLLRLAPLLGAHRLPDRLSRVAGWAGVSVLAAFTIRAVLQHHDPGVPIAPVLAGLAVGAGLFSPSAVGRCWSPSPPVPRATSPSPRPRPR
jgi:branched-subunit amino acid transport protein